MQLLIAAPALLLSLAIAEDFDDLIHQAIQFIIPGYGIDVGNRFKPFIKITVMPFRTPMPSFFKTGGNKKIIISMTGFGILQQPLHIGNHTRSTAIKSFFPEALRPLYIFDPHAT